MSAESQYMWQINGVPVFLGVIAASTTKNNHDTATPFNNTGSALAGKVLLLQADAACHILPGTANTITATTSNGVKLGADERVIITMNSTYGWLACVGSANLRVWELLPQA